MNRHSTLVRCGAAFVLLAVILPNLMYVGHWSSDHDTQKHSADSGVNVAAHAAHCHFGPAKCSGEPALVGTWWVGEEPFKLWLDGQMLPISSAAESTIQELPLGVETPPPRTV